MIVLDYKEKHSINKVLEVLIGIGLILVQVVLIQKVSNLLQ